MVVMKSESYPFDFGQNSLICCVGSSLQKSRTPLQSGFRFVVSTVGRRAKKALERFCLYIAYSS